MLRRNRAGRSGAGLKYDDGGKRLAVSLAEARSWTSDQMAVAPGKTWPQHGQSPEGEPFAAAPRCLRWAILRIGRCCCRSEKEHGCRRVMDAYERKRPRRSEEGEAWPTDAAETVMI